MKRGDQKGSEQFFFDSYVNSSLSNSIDNEIKMNKKMNSVDRNVRSCQSNDCFEPDEHENQILPYHLEWHRYSTNAFQENRQSKRYCTIELSHRVDSLFLLIIEFEKVQ